MAVHASGDAVGKGQESAGGNSATMLERYAASFGAPGMHHLSSMITQGLFGRFPTLQVALLEFGFTWLPALMWRLDSLYDELRIECPWVTELPSETARRHVKITTQPFEYSPACGDDRAAAVLPGLRRHALLLVGLPPLGR